MSTVLTSLTLNGISKGINRELKLTEDEPTDLLQALKVIKYTLIANGLMWTVSGEGGKQWGILQHVSGFQNIISIFPDRSMNIFSQRLTMFYSSQR